MRDWDNPELRAKLAARRAARERKKLRIAGTAIDDSPYRIRNSHKSMLARCYQESNPNYVRYGGRGIKVCEQWLGKTGFDTFVNNMGVRSPGKTLDRFPDRDGDYTPDNCRWATPEEPANNTSSVRSYTIDGVTASVAEWCRRYKIASSTVRYRLDHLNWPIEKALTEPNIDRSLPFESDDFR